MIDLINIPVPNCLLRAAQRHDPARGQPEKYASSDGKTSNRSCSAPVLVPDPGFRSDVMHGNGIGEGAADRQEASTNRRGCDDGPPVVGTLSGAG
jgi:hypothetical protein